MRVERRTDVKGSERWIRRMINDFPDEFAAAIQGQSNIDFGANIDWRSLRCELRPTVKTKFPTGLRNFSPGSFYPANGKGSSDTNDWYASSGVR